jgi:ribonuclease D
MKPELIDSSSKMDNLLARLNGVTLIAVDTEFFRETTYYPQLALVQVATESIVACIDPLAFDARPALKKLLLDDDITKIFHSCSQDLEVLFYYLGEAPGAIYDTQIANALLTDHHQIGYASLVENELGTTLDKSQTRTNWLQRPLTQKQIQYAGDDVLYLYQLQHVLDEKLQKLGRQAWFDEDSEKLLSGNNTFQVAVENLWKRVKGATKLNRGKLAIVQSIAIWREDLARKKDMTRRKILADDIIVNLALNTPDDIQELDRLIGSRYNLDKEDKKQLLEAIAAGQQVPTELCPDNRFNALDSEQKQALKNLQQMVNNKAEELGISAAILGSRKELEKLVLSQDQEDDSSSDHLDIMQGWRRQCVGQQLIDTLKK